MKVTELLENLTQQGVHLWSDRGKLKIHSPKGILTPALRTELAERKTEILALLRDTDRTARDSSPPNGLDLSLQTIGYLIGGLDACSTVNFKPPVIEPIAMAKKLKIAFRPLPSGYTNKTILKFREELKDKLENYGVRIEPWERATKEFSYEINLPLTKWKKRINTRVVKSDITAVIDVERHPSWIGKVKLHIAEMLYGIYSQFVLRNRKISVWKIAQFISWAEDNLRNIENPTNTQTIVLTELDEEFVSPKLSYQDKIPIGVNTLVRTFSEIVIGVSNTDISILNMNLSDSKFPVEKIDKFVLNSLIPKIYVPILPLPMSRFEVGEYDPQQSSYAVQLVRLGRQLASTGLLPSGFKIGNVIKRKSHRDIVDWMANGRTGVSYGFVAYAEPPKYIGAPEISEKEWENLSPVSGYSSNEVRQNQHGRRYLKTRLGTKYAFKQIPDIWLVSSRSGSCKTDLDLECDILRIGLKNKLLLQFPQGVEPGTMDIKPSYDIYVMVAIALATALYLPKLIENGAPMVHFHGYPSKNWFKSENEYYTGVSNPSVPCGTYESGVFNFLGVRNLVERYGNDIALACSIEPDHGTNIIASNWEYLVERIKTGVERGQIELGGKHFASLTERQLAVTKL
ncbi:TubC N-terminal docking domain-related protein [Myxosarcina sp. GI1(2024)]